MDLLYRYLTTPLTVSLSLGFVVCALVYLPARYLERKWTGR